MSQTPNPANPGVKITLGGKERTLRFDFNAFCSFSQVAGREITEVIMTLDPKVPIFRFNDFRTLLWAGLRTSEPKLQLDEVGGWVTLADLKNLQEQLLDAINQVFAKVKAGDADPPDKSQSEANESTG